MVNVGLTKWEGELALNFDAGDSYKFFISLYKCTRSTSVRAFQYLFIHRALVTNVQLFKWKMKETDLCTFCKNSPESIIHLFWHCPLISALWSKIKDWLGTQTRTNIGFLPHEMLLGT